MIWTEKYRPQKFSEIKGQENIVKRVKAFVENHQRYDLAASFIGKGEVTKFSGQESLPNLTTDKLLELLPGACYQGSRECYQEFGMDGINQTPTIDPTYRVTKKGNELIITFRVNGMGGWYNHTVSLKKAHAN